MKPSQLPNRLRARAEKSAPTDRRSKTIRPVDLAAWVESHSASLADQWRTAIISRSGPWAAHIDPLMTRFVELLVAQVPGCLGPYRSMVEPLFLQTSELYGSIAALRGLAAGDVIEEFQGLRESLIRHLYDRGPVGPDAGIGLREALRLNRIVDMGVTQASVGHTDALFFALIEGSGVPEAITPEMLDEVGAQLDGFEEEHASIVAGADSH